MLQCPDSLLDLRMCHSDLRGSGLDLGQSPISSGPRRRDARTQGRKHHARWDRGTPVLSVSMGSLNIVCFVLHFVSSAFLNVSQHCYSTWHNNRTWPKKTEKSQVMSCHVISPCLIWKYYRAVFTVYICCASLGLPDGVA